MTTSTSRIVYTLHGPKTVDISDPYPHGRPIPGAPPARPLVVSPTQSWKFEAPPPYVASINRSDSARAGRSSRTAPYTRPPPRTGQTTPPNPQSTADPGSFHNWQDARRGCVERIKVELDAIANLDASVRIAMITVERERDRYRLAADAAQVELRRVSEERDQLKEQFQALSLKDNGNASPSTSSRRKEFFQKISSTGPLRRKSASFTTSKSSRVTNWFDGQPRCKSAEPWLSGQRGVNDCFDVTIIAPALPPQPSSPRKYSDPGLIRDASRPNEGPRLCTPINKPGEIGIDHIDILYIPYNSRLYCRACHVNRVKATGSRNAEIKIFPNNASWDELRDHWSTEHQSECKEVARLNTVEIQDFRRRLREKQCSS